MDKKIYFITGASGVGKTTLLELLIEKYPHSKVVHFDSIGIPSYEEMEKEYGTWEKFQKVTCIKWIDKLVNEFNDDVIYFEGQVNLDFIIEGFKANNFDNYSIILVDCSNVEMKKRLIERGQPELVNTDMLNWQRFLRKQAEEKSCDIINSTDLSKEELLSNFISVINRSEKILN